MCPSIVREFAIQDLRRRISLDPVAPANLHYNIAVHEVLLGNSQSALHSVHVALKLDDSHPGAGNMLILLRKLAACIDRDKCISDIQRKLIAGIERFVNTPATTQLYIRPK